MITCTFEDGGEARLRHVVTDTLVLKDGKILLGQREKSLLEGGKWGIVGGFVERDETLVQAVEREVYEETGWKVKDITLLKVIDIPNRPGEDRQNISFVFFCTATEKTGTSDWEVNKLKWVDLNNLLPKETIAFDHYESIQYYLKYQKEQFVLPKLA